MIKVENKGTVVTLTIDDVAGTAHTWSPSFERNVCNEFHAELEVMAMNKAIRATVKKAQLDALNTLMRNARKLPGAKRGALRRVFDEVAGYYT